MAITVLGKELIPKMDKLLTVLNRYDPTTRQQLLELLSARHAIEAEMHTPHLATDVAKAMHKHVLQVIKQFREDETNG